MSLLDVKDLQVVYRLPLGRGRLQAVAGVSFCIDEGESVGLVGESGCGKTTLSRAIVGLGRVSAGRILFEGKNIGDFAGDSLAAYRRQVQMVFQDHAGALNPRLSVGRCLEEVLSVHRRAEGEGWRTAEGRHARVGELMERVGLDPALVSRYPHELSGGQRQRVGIARALAVGPRLIIADEPVSALDVSVQVQILNLLKDLQSQFGLAYLFVAHDLAVVRYMCSRILVMYLGRVVEAGSAEAVYGAPAHPYTEALLSAVPDVTRGLAARHAPRRRIVLKGDVPSPLAQIPGCPFHTRCHRVKPVCCEEAPPLRLVGAGHVSVCHFAGELPRDAGSPMMPPGVSEGRGRADG